MPNNEAGALRRSQCLVPHGPGSIVDFRVGRAGAAVSVVAAGLEQWDELSYRKGLANQQVIFEPRLQRRLGVEGFRLPPVARQIAPGVPSKRADRLAGVRFPRWLQCPSCGVVADHRSWFGDPGEPARYCIDCERTKADGVRRPAVPVRFLITCERGHLDDFAWDRWVQHKDGCSRSRPRALRLTSGTQAGLAGLVLRCAECGAERSMEGCFDQRALGGMPCSGRRPWLAAPAEACGETPRVLQRGASNLYFPIIESAIDIPPWSDQVQRRLGRYWSKIVACAPDRRADLIELLGVHVELGMTVAQVVREVEARLGVLENPTETTLRWEEHSQLVRNDQPFGAGTEFEGRPIEPPAELRRYFQRVVVLTRLREVRVLRAFTRIFPPRGDRDPRAAAIQAGPHNWLPGIEVRGEGIFLEFRRERLLAWEARDGVRARAAQIDAAYQRRLQQGGTPRTITPRLLLVHSFSHALMRQLSLDCGYSSASLRERIYVSEGAWDMAGVLLYTASPDSDGTLGGLARQGQAANLARAVEGALASLTWCSSDPLCIDGRASLSHQLNGAACHACMLASETSCEEFNYMLDRATLVGTPADREVGFFADLRSNEDL
jgi:hypothetical protein